jgi:LPS-assembly protein
MRRLPITGISLAVFCSLLPLAAAAQQGLQLKPQPVLTLAPPGPAHALPVFLEADTVRGHTDKETEAEGSVRLRRGTQTVFADWLRYDKAENEVTAIGNVRIQQRGDIVEGDRLNYKLDTDRGFMERPRYMLISVPAAAPPTPGKPRFTDVDARGRAERLLFEGDGRYRAEQAEYTTCEPGNDDWYIRSADLQIDKHRNVGVARDASIVFMGQTIFYSPYLSFPVHKERKSGFLTPHYGSSTRSGTEITVPYYWNIAPNRDATFSPRLLSRRGVLLNNEFRYLERAYDGMARVEVLPGDRERDGDNRYAIFLQHRQALPYNWHGSLNLQKVSDNTYFTDLSTQIKLTSQVLLPREGVLARGGTWGGDGVYAFAAHVQRWQTLQPDVLAPITPPHNRQPQLTLIARNRDVFRSDFDFVGSFVGFDHPTLVSGRRLMAYPSLTLPLQTSYAHLTPKVGAHLTHYALDRNTTTLPDSTRMLPIFTTDAGLMFERDMTFGGQRYTQTLEPRLFYAYIPFRNQDRIPNFDSALMDINLATIFAENQFSGHDRINDANQLTLGVASRFIGADTGAERLRLALAQRYYFQPQRVTVPGVPPRSTESTRSDLLATAGGPVAPNWTVEVGWQYNTDFSQTQKLNLGARYHPRPGQVANFVYRNTLGTVRQADVSAQWPLSGQWTLLGRWNYSLRDGRTLEALGGFEYNGGCWFFRAVAHRFATATQQASTSVFLQLELNGVARIGSNPLDALRRNIAGYARPDVEPTRAEEQRYLGF